MGIDNRDWYRTWWRKKTGYVERASFRLGEAEFQRLMARRRFIRRTAAAAIVVAAVVVAKETHRRRR